MSAVMPWAASECSMPTCMAPKLPPPASTNAVFASPISSRTATHTLPHRRIGQLRGVGVVIAVQERGGLLAPRMPYHDVVPANAKTDNHQHESLRRGGGPGVMQQHKSVVMGPGSRPG